MTGRYDRAAATLAEARPGAATLMRCLPPLDDPRADVTYGQMRARLRRAHWLTAATATAAFAAVNALTRLHPALRVSPVRLLAAAFSIGGGDYQWGVAALTPIALVSTAIGTARVSRTRAGGFWKRDPRSWWRLSSLLRECFAVALHEERVWREGSERWPRRTRTTACLANGGLQALALFLPLSVAVSTALLSGLFTWWYRRAAPRGRREAMEDVVALHWAYYVVVSAVTVVILPVVLTVTVYGLVTA